MKALTIRLTIGKYGDSRASKYGIGYLNPFPNSLFKLMDCLLRDVVNAKWKLNTIEL